MAENVELRVVVGEMHDVTSQIVDVAASQLLSTYAGSDEDGEPHYRSSALSRMLGEKIDEAVTGYVKDVVVEHVEKILAAGVPRTDTYGQRVSGETVSVAELIHERLRKELTERPRGNYSDKPESVLSRVIREEVDRALARELHAEVQTAKSKVKAAIAKQASELLTKAVAQEIKF